MSPREVAWWAIVLVGAGTFAVRASFLVLAEKVAAVPPAAQDALRMVPAAALAALVAPALLRPDGQWDPVGPRALAGLVALAVAWRTRSPSATIVVGLVAVVLLELAIG